ncbi:DUF3631 domain-containing protein [Nocardia sp. NPDC003999]
MSNGLDFSHATEGFPGPDLPEPPAHCPAHHRIQGGCPDCRALYDQQVARQRNRGIDTPKPVSGESGASGETGDTKPPVSPAPPDSPVSPKRGREPIPAVIDGAALLDDVRAAFRKFCVFPSAHAEVAVVLWTVTTHLTPCFEYAPRLVARSPEKRSGKSRLLEVCDPLVYEPLRAVNATVAYIFRSLDADPPPTLLFDEVDTIFGSKKVAEQNEDLRGLLNAGFQRGLPFGRTVGPNHLPMTFETFAMAALAGIGRMPDTIEDRAVVVVMRRRKPSETVAPYRTRRDRPPLEKLRMRIAEWAAGVSESLLGYEPENLGVEDRAADVWEPLVSVADMAGGEWPRMARRAAKVMVEEAGADDEASSSNVQLLADIRSVFAEMHVSFLKSAVLCDQLHQIEESPWKQFELTPSKLGHRLREYGIKTGHNTAKTERGYRVEDFRDAFERYLSGPMASEGVQSRPNGSDQQERRDALNSPDALKASGISKVSNGNRRSDTMGTPLDAFGRPTAENCAECGFDGVPEGETMHHDCKRKFALQQQRDGGWSTDAPR